jgi:hypothetical protein
MSDVDNHKNLVILVADKYIEFAIKGVLSRRGSLRIRSISYDIYVHPGHDAGCRCYCWDFLRPFVNHYSYALVIFDREGCGDEASRENIELEVETKLAQSGWGEHASTIVIDPELEMWVWSDSPHVKSALGWANKHPDLRDWLKQKGFLSPDQLKPARPKEAVEEALREARKAKSSAIYYQLAQSVSLNRCIDPAFLKLKSILQKWFRG